MNFSKCQDSPETSLICYIQIMDIAKDWDQILDILSVSIMFNAHTISTKLSCTGPNIMYTYLLVLNVCPITIMYSKTCLKQPLKKKPKNGFQD